MTAEMARTRPQVANFLIYLTSIVVALLIAESCSRSFTRWYTGRAVAGMTDERE
jgi:hypothetical protein